MTEQELIENHEHPGPYPTCRVCSSEYCPECDRSFFGICEKCGYKILVVLVCIMVVLSYVAWSFLF
jgi:hypothetical protein